MNTSEKRKHMNLFLRTLSNEEFNKVYDIFNKVFMRIKAEQDK